MSITPLPTPVPQRSDPANFAPRGDLFLAALPTFGTEANTLAADVNAKQVLAAASQAAAATSETNAGVFAAASSASANAVIWVSGATVALGANVLSPLDFYRAYRRITATGSGTTDPKNDTTNYILSQFSPFPYLHVREEQASGTSAGTSSSGVNQRTLNTVVGSNTISGASLSSNIVTLPAGSYEFYAVAPLTQSTSASVSRLTLYNSTDSTDIMLGSGAQSGVQASGASPGGLGAICFGKFTLAATKGVKLNQYVSASGINLGVVCSTGQAEVFSSLQIWKVA